MHRYPGDRRVHTGSHPVYAQPRNRSESKEKAKGSRYRLRLWRARLRSFRFLCLRIFLRRFLMTLPTSYLGLLAESLKSARTNTP